MLYNGPRPYIGQVSAASPEGFPGWLMRNYCEQMLGYSQSLALLLRWIYKQCNVAPLSQLRSVAWTLDHHLERQYKRSSGDECMSFILMYSRGNVSDFTKQYSLLEESLTYVAPDSSINWTKLRVHQTIREGSNLPHLVIEQWKQNVGALFWNDTFGSFNYFL